MLRSDVKLRLNLVISARKVNFCSGKGKVECGIYHEDMISKMSFV